MAPADKTGRVVFIGNIPYGLTEEQIIHTFNNVGQVVNFRLVYDKDSGRPKGFGFMEFSDADAAASAVRNLNDFEIMGRKLRVDYSNESSAGDSSHTNTNPQQQQQQSYQAPQQQQLHPQGPPANNDIQQNALQSSLPPLPSGADLPANLTCPDAISRTLSTLPPPQLLDILSQMKGLVMSDPNKATELLRQAPQLSYAIFQSLLLLGLVDTSVLASVVDQAQPSQQQQRQPQAPLPPPPPQQAQIPMSTPQNPYQAQFPPPPQFLQMNAPTPPAQILPYQMPHTQQTKPQQQQQQQHQQPQQQQQQQQQHGMPDHAALVNQIMSMTQQQIDALPPAERAQLMQARQAILSGQGF